MQIGPQNPLNIASLWALLVGIDTYKASGMPPLRGSVNDVEAMRQFLANQLGVPADHIRTLTNEQATRAEILRTFQEFLIRNPHIQFNDQILFHFSGHGSQLPDTSGTEPDGLDETIVAYDSRTSDPYIYDIPDKTIAALLDQLTQEKGNHITVIFDSCHSGSGTRGIQFPGAVCVRLAPDDTTRPPADLDAEIRGPLSTHRVGPSGWARAEDSYVLLAACLDNELAKEYRSLVEGQEINHGALTYFTLQALRDIDYNMTYGDLHELITARVNAEYPDQTPQCEGDRDRQIFGGMRLRRDPFILVKHVDEDENVVLEAGLVSGLYPGTKLALYPPDTRTLEQLPATPLAMVEVVDVNATAAFARLSGIESVVIPPGARGIITEQGPYQVQTVALLAGDGKGESQRALDLLAQEIKNRSSWRPLPYVKVVSDPAAKADLYVKATAGKLSIYNANGSLLAEPDQRGPAVISDALESITRYRRVVQLSNEDHTSELGGKITLQLLRGLKRQQFQVEETDAIPVGPGGELIVSYHPGQREQNVYTPRITNASQSPVFVTLFALSSDYSISLIYPNHNQREALTPGSSFLLPPIQSFLSPGWSESKDYLKVFVTRTYVDMRNLGQSALRVPPPGQEVSRGFGETPALLELIKSIDTGTRALLSAAILAQEDWTTITLPVTTVRATQSIQLIPSGGKDIALGDGITIVEKPEGFQGTVKVTTTSAVTRGLNDTAELKPPPFFERLAARFPASIQPIRRTGRVTRGGITGNDNLVLTFEVENAAHQSVTTETPLRLNVPGAAGEEPAEVLAVAFDGEDYLLVGYPDDKADNTVKIVELPPAEPTGTRGLGHAIQLFLYKKMGRYTSQTGLRRAELKNDKVDYQAVERGQFQAGQHVALFVHGFTADTSALIRGLAQFLRKEVVPYDHLLTWDYESFNTSVEESGAQLALDLQRLCGFDPSDGITLHVFAHSMGCLIARYMIELADGFQFVDALVLAGSPNNGTTLASVTRSATFFLANVVLNQFSAVPVLSVFDSLLKQLYDQGKGWTDLAMGSPLVTKLNALKEPSNVPYLELVGDPELDDQDNPERNRINRLAQKVFHQTLDGLFGEHNDVVIGISSMAKGLRGGGYPAVTTQMLTCDHFHYYDFPQSLDAVKRWIQAAEKS